MNIFGLVFFFPSWGGSGWFRSFFFVCVVHYISAAYTYTCTRYIIYISPFLKKKKSQERRGWSFWWWIWLRLDLEGFFLFYFILCFSFLPGKDTDCQIWVVRLSDLGCQIIREKSATKRVFERKKKLERGWECLCESCFAVVFGLTWYHFICSLIL